MCKECWNCEHYRYDHSNGDIRCEKRLKMPEQDFNEHFIKNKPNCPKWAKYDDLRGGLL